MARRRQGELDFELGRWGGRRRRAGRKPAGPRAGVAHRRRPAIGRRSALHVTVRVDAHVRSLRRHKVARVLARAFRAGCARSGFRLCHFSIQGNHIHLIVEADTAIELSQGMQAWTIRVARAINRVQGRTGKVFPDRYHAVQLRTARQVRAALCYVLQNARRHGIAVPRGSVDPFSSAWWFTGWQHERWRAGLKAPPEGPTVAAAEGWILTAGWRRWGAVGVDEVPPPPRVCRACSGARSTERCAQ